LVKEYDHLPAPEDASLSVVMLTADKDMKTQHAQNIIHFQITKVCQYLDFSAA